MPQWGGSGTARGRPSSSRGLPALEHHPAQALCGPSVSLFTQAVCPPGFPYEKVVQRVLYLQVLDYDRFSRNDPIGEVSIPLNKVDLTQMQTFWKDLKPCSDGSVRPHVWVPGLGAGRSGLADLVLVPWHVRRAVGEVQPVRRAAVSELVHRAGQNCLSCDKEPGLCSGSGGSWGGGRRPELPDEGTPGVTEVTDGGG